MRKVFNYLKLLFIILVLMICVKNFYVKREYISGRLVLPDIVEWERPAQKTAVIHDGIEVKQYFTPNFDGLFRIGICVEYKKPLEAKMVVSLKDKGRELFREVIPLKKVVPDRMRRFSFAPIWNSKDKTYCLAISTLGANPENGLKLFYGTWPFFHMMRDGRLYLNENEIAGELSMVSECRVDVKKGGFIKRWHDFVDDKNFVIFYVSVTAACLISLFLFMLL